MPDISKPVGAHVSIAGGVENAPLNARKIGAKAFALFTKNQRQWNAPPLPESGIKKFKQNVEAAGIPWNYILPHDSYLINLGHPDDVKREKSFNAFVTELERCRLLGLNMLNFHPGSHIGLIEEKSCLDNIVSCIDLAAERVNHVIMVIENTAGQGSNVGYKFDHLQYIIEHSRHHHRIGFCLDTCHMFAAGYDIRSKDAYEATMQEFHDKVGFSKLCGMHLNDSKKRLGSRVDRHESIGKGEIGLEPFRFIMQDPRITGIPLILETPVHELWPEEIKMLVQFATTNLQG
jgi:deoxyribonuclease-4